MRVVKKRMTYRQPHNINMPMETPALKEREAYYLHSKEKHMAKKSLREEIKRRYGTNLTKKQIKVIQRREEALYLASNELLYCDSHQRILCVKDVLERNCYIRHSNDMPFCKYLMMKTENDNLVPFRLRGLAKTLFNP